MNNYHNKSGVMKSQITVVDMLTR